MAVFPTLGASRIARSEADMRGDRLTTRELAQRIQEEFEEAPGLAITVNQGARFWTIDAKTCERVLTRLQAAGFLVRASDGHFKRRPTV